MPGGTSFSRSHVVGARRRVSRRQRSRSSIVSRSGALHFLREEGLMAEQAAVAAHRLTRHERGIVGGEEGSEPSNVLRSPVARDEQTAPGHRREFADLGLEFRIENQAGEHGVTADVFGRTTSVMIILTWSAQLEK